MPRDPDNVLLLMLHDTLRSQVRTDLDQRIEDVFEASTGPKAATDDEHRALVDAIRQHDPHKAHELMRSHPVSVRRSPFEMF